MRILFLCHGHPSLQAGGTEIAAHALFRALQSLESEFPELLTADSPTQRVIGKVLPGLVTRREAEVALIL